MEENKQIEKPLEEKDFIPIEDIKKVIWFPLDIHNKVMRLKLDCKVNTAAEAVDKAINCYRNVAEKAEENGSADNICTPDPDIKYLDKELNQDSIHALKRR